MHCLLLALVVIAAPDTLELSLADAFRQALATSPDRVEADVSGTQAGSQLARGIAGLLPTVSASVGYARSSAGSSYLPDTLQLPDDWYWTGSLTLNQVVFDPQVFAGLAGGIIYHGYYRADARDRRAKLVYDVTADYLGLLKARLLRDVADAALRRARENLRVVREKSRLGSASAIEVMRSEVQEAQAGIDLLGADRTLAAAGETFKATVGLDRDVVVRPVEELAEPSGFEVTDPDSLVALIARHGPGAVLAARARAAARLNVAAAVGRALPGISAYWTSSYTDSTFPSGIRHWDDRDDVTWGLQATFPLLDLKSYVLNIVDASAESRRAGAAARRTALQLRVSATTAVLGYTEARERYDNAARNLELNRRLDELAADQYRLGAISLLELLDVQAGAARAQASHVEALCDTYIEAARINYLLGVTDGPGEEAE